MDIKELIEKAFDDAEKKGLFISRWTPVSERLPESGMNVLVSTRWNALFKTRYEEDSFYLYGLPIDDDVIAWMPLPEPYKEREEK